MTINWTILGLEPTQDISAIKKAYRVRLQETNPEDKPEEFMALREAYETALNYARNGGETEGNQEDGQPAEISIDDDLLPEEHPAYQWSRKLIDLYKDFSRRIDVANWNELVSDPLCTRIDTAGDVENAMLRFFMEWWYVPDSVIRALNDVFHFDENVERLMNQYPTEFVDAILLTPLGRTSGGFDYQMFSGPENADYDAYIRMYYSLTGFVSRREHEEAWQCIADMEASGIFHPYINIEKTKIYLNDSDVERAEEAISAIWPQYQDSPAVCCMAGELELVKENFEEARFRFAKGLEIYEDSRWAKIGLAESNLGLGNLDDAEDWVNQVLAEDRYSPRGKELEAQISAAQKDALMEKRDANTLSSEEQLKLGMIHIDNGDYEAAINVLSSFTSDNRMEEGERLHFLATAELDIDNLPDSLTHFTAAEEVFRSLLEVTSDEEEQRRIESNICRSMIMKSLSLEQLEKMEEALETVTNATIDFPGFNMPHCRKAELHYELHQYQEAVDAAAASIKIDDTFHLPFRIRANAYYEMGYYNEAFDDCNSCINLYTGDIEAFFCKINILIEVGEIEAAVSEIDDLENQVQGTKIVFLRAKAHEAAKELEAARDAYLKVLEMEGDEEREVFYPAELTNMSGTYYRLYQVYNGLWETKRDSDAWHNAMKYLKQGYDRYPDNLALMSELAGEYYSQSRHLEAQKLYEKMISLDPSGRHYSQLAGNEIQLDRFDDAKVHLEEAVKRDERLTYAQILLGALYTHLGDYPKAISHYELALELSERNEEVWYRIYREMANAYGRMKEIDKAIECLDKNYELYEQEEDFSTKLEFLRIQGKFDEVFRLGEAYLAEHEIEDSLQVLDELKYVCHYLQDNQRFEKYNAMDVRDYTKGHQTGRLYMYQNGKYMTALDHFLAAGEHRRNSIDNNIELAKLYMKMKNKKKAAACARKVLDAIPEDFEDCGYSRAYYLVRSAEALAILGDFAEAKKRLERAINSRKCDFCKYSGCIDAYCALAYIACIQGNEQDLELYTRQGQEVAPYDYDLRYLKQHYFMPKKRGFFR
ncbi:MAG: tetratricopeptide repeat protein [Firmicutes bacterium]|nr:tetratricopeptide repeat protein [Bacillota bacterium]